jgi:hypothetical protein
VPKLHPLMGSHADGSCFLSSGWITGMPAVAAQSTTSTHAQHALLLVYSLGAGAGIGKAQPGGNY